MKNVAMMLCLLGVMTSMNANENTASKSANLPSIGPQIGAKAPAFELRDQFGHQQTNETLRGTNGTVLLFFRSADW